MDEARRNWWFTAVVIATLLLLGAIDSTIVTLAVTGGLLVLGLVMLPRQRARGTVTGLLAGCVALAVVLVMHALR